MLVKKIADGDMGIAQTVTAMIALAHDPETTQEIRDMSLWIINNAGAKSDMDKARAIYEWMSNRVAYNRDPVYREFVQPPVNLLRLSFQGYPNQKSHQSAGDCDDHATAIAALLSAAGFLTRFVVTAESPRSNVWSHIYTEVLVDDKWVPVDSSMWFVKFGERVKAPQSTYIYPGDVNPDSIFEARKNPGLGFVSSVVNKDSQNVLAQMRSRVNKPQASPYGLGQSGLTYEQYMEANRQKQVLAQKTQAASQAKERAAEAQGTANVIKAVGQFVNAGVKIAGTAIITAISGKTEKKLAKLRLQARQIITESATELQKVAMELEHEAAMAEGKLEHLKLSEALALQDRMAELNKEKYIAIALVSLPALAIVAVQFSRKFAEYQDKSRDEELEKARAEMKAIRDAQALLRG